MLILHFLGLTMGLGTSFAHAFLDIVVSKMPADEATKFRLHSLVLSKMGHIGIALLIISGAYLIIPYWKIIPTTPLLILKLVLVIFLVILLLLINLSSKNARTGNAEAELKTAEKYGKMTLLIGLIIVVVAVAIFH